MGEEVRFVTSKLDPQNSLHKPACIPSFLGQPAAEDSRKPSQEDRGVLEPLDGARAAERPHWTGDLRKK